MAGVFFSIDAYYDNLAFETSDSFYVLLSRGWFETINDC